MKGTEYYLGMYRDGTLLRSGHQGLHKCNVLQCDFCLTKPVYCTTVHKTMNILVTVHEYTVLYKCTQYIHIRTGSLNILIKLKVDI